MLPPLDLQHGLPSLPCPKQEFASQPSHDFLQRSGIVVKAEPITLHHGLPELPPVGLKRGNSVAMMPPPPPANQANFDEQTRNQLRSRGHIHYGDAKTADAFIVARSLRRYSSPASDHGGNIVTSKLNTSNRLTIRAIIRPRLLERQSFLVQRTFDIDKLRASVPDPKCPSSLPIISERRPSCAATGISPRSRYTGRRTGLKSAERLSGRGQSSVSMDHETLTRDAKAVPIRECYTIHDAEHLDHRLTLVLDLMYTRAYLPVLTALLTSGHVREGDVIYLPLPHAEAWLQTVEYIYTGKSELSVAMRDNIFYLAGKV